MGKDTVTFGGTGGSDFADVVVRSVGARAGVEVDAIYLNGVRYGSDGGSDRGSLTLADDEYFNYLWVRSGLRVDNFELRTNKGRSFGRFPDGNGGSEQTFANIRILSIGGRSGARLDQLRVTMIISSNASWMSDNLPMIGKRQLGQICIPGSHDSGMSRSHNGTIGGGNDNTQTQHLDIFDQLRAGCRFFDIRPIIGGGTFWTGHYTDTHKPVLGVQGARGASIDEIIDQVNRFTNSNPELVILHLSHDMNTDSGYRSFTEEEWNRLLTRLEGLKWRYSSSVSNLTATTINSFIGSGNAAVVVIVPSEAPLGARWGKGFFYDDNLQTTGKYANTPDLKKMIDDQLEKMGKHRDSYFKMSWTLTQSDTMAVMNSPIIGGVIDVINIGGAPTKLSSILNMASEANRHLESSLFPKLDKSTGTFPRILSIDAVGTNVDIGAVAIKINRYLCQT